MATALLQAALEDATSSSLGDAPVFAASSITLAGVVTTTDVEALVQATLSRALKSVTIKSRLSGNSTLKEIGICMDYTPVGYRNRC